MSNNKICPKCKSIAEVNAYYGKVICTNCGWEEPIDTSSYCRNSSFDAKECKEEIIKWIRNWFADNGPECNAVIGISGGKDSSIVAALCVEALGRDRVIGVLMPNGVQNDIDYAKDLVEYLGIKSYIVDIEKVVNDSRWNVIKALGAISEQAAINLPARIRMTSLYAISQSLNGRVANTCNLSENWIGYSTKYGDAAGDFSPLHNLTVSEVKEIGYLLLPNKYVDKVPSDGLCGKTDEDNLGFSYEVLDKYIRTGEIENQEIKDKIDTLHSQNLFKLLPMDTFINC